MAAADDPPPGQHPPRTPSFVDHVLQDTQYCYSLVLLTTFIVGAAWYSVFNAKKNGEFSKPSTVKGPGGKPLPVTKRKPKVEAERKIGPKFGPAAKNAFRYLASMVFLSYVATASALFVHAFYHEDPVKWSREGLPYAGEYTVVSIFRH